MLGLHWVADLDGCKTTRLVPECVREALIEVPNILGLHAVGPPQVTEHSDVTGNSSIAGVVLLRESHASCHVFPGSRIVHLDVFCCRRVEFEPVARFAAAHFGAASIHTRVLERRTPESGVDSASIVVRRVR